jgi:hypothetical protein
MTKAFYSFHFANDVSRAGQVRNIGAVTGDQVVDDNSWEQVKRGGESAIKSWIDKQMDSCDVVVVLVGTDTASRHWIDYEIRRAWDIHKPVVGIRIHGLKNFQSQTSLAGADPFGNVGLNGGGKLSDHVPLHNPAGSTSQDVYATIASEIKTWIKNAPSRKR